MSMLPLHFVDGRTGNVQTGSIRSGWTAHFQAQLYLIRWEYHNRDHAVNRSMFGPKVVLAADGKPTGEQRTNLHDNIREWCETTLGYTPVFSETYLDHFRDGRELCERFNRYSVYSLIFFSEEDRMLFRMKWSAPC
jgi:hypothetical protein